MDYSQLLSNPVVNELVAKNLIGLRTLSFEIHSRHIASMMSVVNYLFLFCDCHFSISQSMAFFGGTGYSVI